MSVLVTLHVGIRAGGAKAVASVDVEMGESVGFGDRLGKWA
jgi:hypothetical protein